MKCRAMENGHLLSFIITKYSIIIIILLIILLPYDRMLQFNKCKPVHKIQIRISTLTSNKRGDNTKIT